MSVCLETNSCTSVLVQYLLQPLLQSLLFPYCKRHSLLHVRSLLQGSTGLSVCAVRLLQTDSCRTMSSFTCCPVLCCRCAQMEEEEPSTVPGTGKEARAQIFCSFGTSRTQTLHILAACPLQLMSDATANLFSVPACSSSSLLLRNGTPTGDQRACPQTDTPVDSNKSRLSSIASCTSECSAPAWR